MKKIHFEKWFESDIGEFSSLLESIRVFVDGRVQLKAFQTHDLVSLLQSAIKSNDYSRESLHSAVLRTLTDGDLKIPLELENLASTIQKNIYSTLGKNEQYVLMSGFNFAGDIKRKWLVINGVRLDLRKSIAVEKSAFRKFTDIRNEALSEVDMEGVDEALKDSYLVKISIEARSPSEAANKAIEVFDVFRGLLNYIINRRRRTSISYGSNQERRVFNNIGVHRFHTLHEQNGKVISGHLYYNRRWNSPHKLVELNERASEIFTEHLNFFLKQLNQKRKVSKNAYYALGAYCKALDIPGYQDAFIRLWAVIEYLSGVSQGDSHDKIVKRTSALYSDAAIAKLYLQHLKKLRNNLVHEGLELSTRDEEQIIYQLNRFACKLIDQYLGRNRLFAQSEVIRYLDHLADIRDYEGNTLFVKAQKMADKLK